MILKCVAQTCHEEPERPIDLEITNFELIGKGAFGAVYKALVKIAYDDKIDEKIYAVKQVNKNCEGPNRELSILKTIKHTNIVSLKYFFENTIDNIECINMVFEHNTTNLLRFIRNYFKTKNYIPVDIIEILMYQLFRGIGYLHSCGICHRDIKPENLMIDTPSNALKIGDFGSAVKLVPGEPHIAYICSRYYRAPELILGWKLYTFSIDIWSAGCVLGEMLQGDPIFVAPTSIDLFCEIARVLGTPSKEDLDELNPAFSSFNFPIIDKRDLFMKFRNQEHVGLVDLLQKVLVFKPSKRLDAYTAMTHNVFHTLISRIGNKIYNKENDIPELLDFTPNELLNCPNLKEFTEIYENSISNLNGK